MKRKFRAFPRWLFALALVCSLLTVTASATAVPTEEEAYQAMIALKSEYPDDMEYDDDNGYPVDDTAWKGGIFHTGYGCVGFAMILSDAAFGDLPADMISGPDVTWDSLKVGDIVRIKNDSHSFIILKKDDSGVEIAQANVHQVVSGVESEAGYIKWGDTMTKEEVMEHLSSPANYVLTRYTGGTVYNSIMVHVKYRVNNQQKDQTNVTYNAIVGTRSAMRISIQSLLNNMQENGDFNVPKGKDAEYAQYSLQSIATAQAVESYVPGDEVDVYVDYTSSYTPVTITMRHYINGVEQTADRETFTDKISPPVTTDQELNDALRNLYVQYNSYGDHIMEYPGYVSAGGGPVRKNYSLGEAVEMETHYIQVSKAEVTFKVVGGSWDDGTSAEKTETATGQMGNPPAFYEGQIPAVGTKPDANHQVPGSWDMDPSTAALADGKSYTFTYTYAPKPVTVNVTFKVVGGSWDDGTSADKVVKMTGTADEPPIVTVAQIPEVGKSPAAGYQASGTWDKSPHGVTVQDGDVFTYTYAKAQTVTANVTFQVVGGAWDDGTTAAKTVTVTGTATSALALTASDVPSVGAYPATGYQATGAWDKTPYGVSVQDGDVFTYTYTKAQTVTATVTFKVVGGAWDDGTTAPKTATVTGVAGGAPLVLTESQVPAVGSRPDASHQASGSWDRTPTAVPVMDGDVITYTYAEKQAQTAAVTFKVVGGSWNDGTSADKTVTVTGTATSAPVLTSGMVPSVGAYPAAGYQTSGTWDKTPYDASVQNGDVFTYTYDAQSVPQPVTASVTFQVVGGYWNDGTTTAKTVTVTGTAASALALTASDVPGVGQYPAMGYQTSGTWDKTPYGATVQNGDVFTFTYDAQSVPQPVTASVTFQVVGGAWNDGTTAAKTVTVTGTATSAPALTASDVPGVGQNPATGYQTSGAWDKTPFGATVQNGDVFTYTYDAQSAPQPVTASVTFQVVGGAWNDGTTAAKTVTVTGTATSAPALTASDVPGVGQNPATGYQTSGAWDKTPYGATVQNGDVFTYTYDAQSAPQPVTASVTFQVVGGFWDDGTAAAKAVTVTGTATSAPALTASDVPGVGQYPAMGYQTSGAWDKTPYGATVQNGDVFTYTYDAQSGGGGGGGGSVAPVYTINVSGPGTVQDGSSGTYSAVVSVNGTPDTSLTVTWAVVSPDSGITIDSSGVLTVPAGTPADTWATVNATYTAPGGAALVQGYTVYVTAAPASGPFNVTYESNNGLNEDYTDSVPGGALTLPSSSFTAPDGKQFKAWQIQNVMYNPGQVYTITANTTVTAVWESPTSPVPTPGTPSTQGCYVATAVYGSYDCPEVWTLRRFRDQVLAKTWYGRLFIRFYYAVSPTAVKLFGNTQVFQNFFRSRLDPWVANLQADGFASTPYKDLDW